MPEVWWGLFTWSRSDLATHVEKWFVSKSGLLVCYCMLGGLIRHLCGLSNTLGNLTWSFTIIMTPKLVRRGTESQSLTYSIALWQSIHPSICHSQRIDFSVALNIFLLVDIVPDIALTSGPKACPPMPFLPSKGRFGKWGWNEGDQKEVFVKQSWAWAEAFLLWKFSSISKAVNWPLMLCCITMGWFKFALLLV